MKDGKWTIVEEDLHRFVDGELNEADASAFADRLSKDEALRKRVDDYREINRKLGEIYHDKRPIPTRLLLAVSSRGAFPFSRVAASLLLLVIGGLIGYSMRGQLVSDQLMRPLPIEAASAHAVYVPEVRHPVEVKADEQEHLNAWLSKRLNRPIAAPDLRAAGYSLIGGRLLPDGHRPAAQFMFEDEAGQRITLYIRHALDTQETSFRHADAEGLGIVYWVDNGLAYALTAPVGKDELITAAQIVYRETNP
jgi:anti-sigma factor RsiW